MTFILKRQRKEKACLSMDGSIYVVNVHLENKWQERVFGSLQNITHIFFLFLSLFMVLFTMTFPSPCCFCSLFKIHRYALAVGAFFILSS